MTPEEITLSLSEALDKFFPIQWKPTDYDITRLSETLTPLLLDIPYDIADARHNLWGCIAPDARYKTKYVVSFARPRRLAI